MGAGYLSPCSPGMVLRCPIGRTAQGSFGYSRLRSRRRESSLNEPVPPIRLGPAVGRALRWGMALPGRASDAVWDPIRPPLLPQASLEVVAAAAARAPRGNGYLALEPGLHRWAVGGSVFAVRLHARNAFAVGGLLAEDPAEAGRDLSALRRHLARAGVRRLLFFPVGASEAGALREAGLGCVPVGGEAFVELAGFTLAGGAFADLRQMCNRARRRHGLWVQELDPLRDGPAFRRVHKRWLVSRPNGHPMALLVGSACLDRPLGRRYFGVRRDDGELVAVSTWCPGWDGAGWGVDIMARDPQAPGGAMELLLSEVMQRLRDEGFGRVSLGASPMAPVAAGQPVPPHLRLVFDTLRRSTWANHLFHFEPLFRFKDKFRPRWDPVLIGGWPDIGSWSLYVGCRLWGLFDASPISGSDAPFR